MQEAIPAGLLLASRKDTFLAWLRGIGLDQEDKKQLLMYWADRVGTKVTGDMVKRAGIE
jgi:hypothetical protein